MKLTYVKYATRYVMTGKAFKGTVWHTILMLCYMSVNYAHMGHSFLKLFTSTIGVTTTQQRSTDANTVDLALNKHVTSFHTSTSHIQVGMKLNIQAVIHIFI